MKKTVFIIFLLFLLPLLALGIFGVSREEGKELRDLFPYMREKGEEYLSQSIGSINDFLIKRGVSLEREIEKEKETVKEELKETGERTIEKVKRFFVGLFINSEED